MALTPFFFAASILLLSSLVITSANDYSYDSRTDTVKPGYHPKSDANIYDNTPKPDLPKPTLTIPKSDNEKPNYGYDSIPEAPLPIGIEGLVLCKSGSNYIPIKGNLSAPNIFLCSVTLQLLYLKLLDFDSAWRVLIYLK
jgi:hypothetical protein